MCPPFPLFPSLSLPLPSAPPLALHLPLLLPHQLERRLTMEENKTRELTKATKDLGTLLEEEQSKGKTSEGTWKKALQDAERHYDDLREKWGGQKRTLTEENGALDEALSALRTQLEEAAAAAAGELKACRAQLGASESALANMQGGAFKDGLEGMERHLIQLSEKLRRKEQQVNHLEKTVHRECKERGRLVEELERIRAGAMT